MTTKKTKQKHLDEYVRWSLEFKKRLKNKTLDNKEETQK